jgi:hypothetical protein
MASILDSGRKSKVFGGGLRQRLIAEVESPARFHETTRYSDISYLIEK